MDFYLKLVDFLISQTNDQSLLVLKTIPEQTVILGFTNFVAENDHAWISDREIDLTKCNTKVVVFEQDKILDLVKCFEHLSPKQQKEFWIHVCIIIGKDVKKIEEERTVKINQALVNFSNDLKSIQIDIAPVNLFNFVTNNYNAILHRSRQELTEDLVNLTPNNEKQFWEHMEFIWNLINPYNKIVQNSTHNLLNQLISQIGPDNGNDLTAVLEKFLNPNIVGILKPVIENGGIEEMIKNLTGMLPKTN